MSENNEHINSDNDITNETGNDLLKECQTNLAQMKDKYVYLNAEFENFKKRTDKERSIWMATAQTAVLTDILPIVDDFERALTATQKSEIPAQIGNYISGFELTLKSLQKILKKYDVSEIEVGKVFNPELHEAIMSVEAPEHESGSVVTILEKGYTHKGNVIRPAKVSVAK